MLWHGFETFKRRDLSEYFQCGYNKVIKRPNSCKPKEEQILGSFVLFIWLGCGSNYCFQFWQQGVWVRFQNQPIPTQLGKANGLTLLKPL